MLLICFSSNEQVVKNNAKIKSLPASSFTSTSTVARSSSRVITSHWNQLHRRRLVCSECFFACSSTTSQSSTLRANKCTSQTRCHAGSYLLEEPPSRVEREIAEDTVISISTIIADTPVSNSRIEKIRQECTRDEEIQLLREYLRNGFPDDNSKLSSNIRQYRALAADL